MRRYLAAISDGPGVLPSAAALPSQPCHRSMALLYRGFPPIHFAFQRALP